MRLFGSCIAAVALIVGWSPVGAAADTVTYIDTIKPLLALRCCSCHGASKQKGGLRLDAPEWITKGGKNGAVVVPGKPEDSPLYALTILPMDDLDVMPQKGELLTKEQTDRIAQWIRDGAVMEIEKVEEKKAPAAAATVATAAGAKPVNAFDAIAIGIPAPDPSVVKAMEAMGIVVTGLSTNRALLDVTVSHSHGETADKLRLLDRIAPNILWLDLRGTTVGDAQMKSIAKLGNLTRLHLERTAVGDAGIAQLTSCTRLEYLNVYGTKVTDAGLQALAVFKGLKQLYVWQTAVTPEGIAALQKSMPGLEIVAGP